MSKKKAQIKRNKRLTGETKIDSLRKFAKTSHAAEVILDRLKVAAKK